MSTPAKPAARANSRTVSVRITVPIAALPVALSNARTVFPPGRKGKPSDDPRWPGEALVDYTIADYIAAYGGASGARGTYAATANTLAVRHIGDLDPGDSRTHQRPGGLPEVAGGAG